MVGGLFTHAPPPPHTWEPRLCWGYDLTGAAGGPSWSPPPGAAAATDGSPEAAATSLCHGCHFVSPFL